MIDPDIPLEVLFSILNRNHFVFVNKEAKHLNITGSQMPCLKFISHKPGITQEDLANTFQIDKGSIARAVKKLEDNELLYRINDPANRRKYLIFLTEKGENIIPEIKGIEERWKKIVCEGLNEDENSKLMEFMNLLAENSIEKIKNRS